LRQHRGGVGIGRHFLVEHAIAQPLRPANFGGAACEPDLERSGRERERSDRADDASARQEVRGRRRRSRGAHRERPHGRRVTKTYSRCSASSGSPAKPP
jgi:hypothetical protein